MKFDLTSNVIAQAMLGMDLSVGRTNHVSVPYDEIRIKTLGSSMQISFCKDGVVLISKCQDGLSLNDEISLRGITGDFHIEITT
jgi:hypothetical protein